MSETPAEPATLGSIEGTVSRNGEQQHKERHIPPAPNISDSAVPTSTAHRQMVASFSPEDVTLLLKVQSVVKVLTDLLTEGLRGAELLDTIIESVPPSLFITHSMVSSPAIFRSIRKVLNQA